MVSIVVGNVNYPDIHIAFSKIQIIQIIRVILFLDKDSIKYFNPLTFKW